MITKRDNSFEYISLFSTLIWHTVCDMFGVLAVSLKKNYKINITCLYKHIWHDLETELLCRAECSALQALQDGCQYLKMRPHHTSFMHI